MWRAQNPAHAESPEALIDELTEAGDGTAARLSRFADAGNVGRQADAMHRPASVTRERLYKWPVFTLTRSASMNQERPAPEDLPGSDGIEVLQRQFERNTRELNGTGDRADEDQLGVSDEEVDDLEDDAKGG